MAPSARYSASARATAKATAKSNLPRSFSAAWTRKGLKRCEVMRQPCHGRPEHADQIQLAGQKVDGQGSFVVARISSRTDFNKSWVARFCWCDPPGPGRSTPARCIPHDPACRPPPGEFCPISALNCNGRAVATRWGTSIIQYYDQARYSISLTGSLCQAFASAAPFFGVLHVQPFLSDRQSRRGDRRRPHGDRGRRRGS